MEQKQQPRYYMKIKTLMLFLLMVVLLLLLISPWLYPKVEYDPANSMEELRKKLMYVENLFLSIGLQ